MTIDIVQADLGRPDHARDYLDLMDHFALDPMAGGAPLDPAARARLVPALCARRDVTVLFARTTAPPGGGRGADPDGEAEARGRARRAPDGGAGEAPSAVGLATLIEGFSTYAAAPLWNLHDMVVRSGYRGQGIGRRLLDEIGRLARARGYCKVTLEVLAGNERAKAAYRAAGYAPYALDPTRGAAEFWEYKLPGPATDVRPVTDAPPV